ncbi:hypothetical protein INT43_003331 [Umbelopsis isabellina]|uniref:Translation initiation factor eIF2B subunit beta n=1 Tax=Mortierella isabellina TaxID=91625 RepID=A0A8H7PQK7_MORIS|nr:hypothetical protein INT43_003331 [Umbelopsis isabellina]
MVLSKALESQVEDFISRLKRRQIVGSYEVAKETAIILRQVVSTTRWSDASVLVHVITDLGRRLVAAQPKELAVGNIVRRVLKIIREVVRGELETDDIMNSGTSEDSDGFSQDSEDDADSDREFKSILAQDTEDTDHTPRPEIPQRPKLQTESSMFNLLVDKNSEDIDYSAKSYNMKPLIIQEINEEIIADLETVYKGIADQALEHIHANEVIMTIGYSRTVKDFLTKAAAKRSFQVIVAETSPTLQGQAMAASLAEVGIETTVITDSAIHAVMSRVNKVVLGAHAVLANGGLVAVTGSQMVAAAAKHHTTPVLVCTALYKLSPLFPYDVDLFNVCVTPEHVLSFNEGTLIDKVNVLNPYYDFVAPELVNLFVHNLGSAPPSYVYRLINDNYDLEDTTL